MDYQQLALNDLSEYKKKDKENKDTYDVRKLLDKYTELINKYLKEHNMIEANIASNHDYWIVRLKMLFIKEFVEAGKLNFNAAMELEPASHKESYWAKKNRVLKERKK